MDICLCQICDCKNWKLKYEKIKKENESYIKKIESFTKCDICGDFEQNMPGCSKCENVYVINVFIF